MNLYECLKNPLENDEVLDKLIYSYSKDCNMYNELIKENSDKKIKNKCNGKDIDKFTVYVFETWKDSLLNSFFNGPIKYKNNPDIILLTKYLKELKPRNSDEVCNIITGNRTNDIQIKEALKKYTFIDYDSYWNHIHSSFITAGRLNDGKTEHRLYINCDSTAIYNIILRFIQKCQKEKIGYYFKYDAGAIRADSIVFYSDTENLHKYIKILNEIKTEENLDSAVYNPPIATAVIDNWIGYGSEPSRKEKKQSYNRTRADIIEDAIIKTRFEWLQKNFNTIQIRTQKRNVYYKDYILQRYAKDIIDDIIKTTKRDKTEVQQLYRGYTTQEVTTKEFSDYVTNFILNHKQEIYDCIINGKELNLTLPIKNKKENISYILSLILKDETRKIAKSDPNFKKELQKNIKIKAKENGVDPEKFACDIKDIEKLKRISLDNQKSNEKIDTNYNAENKKKIEEIVKINGDISNYLQNTKFNVFEAECRRNELIEYLYNTNSFYTQNIMRITSFENDQDKIGYLLDMILLNYNSALAILPQRETVKYDVYGRKITDFDFYVILRSKLMDNCENSTVEINQMINSQKTR